MGLILDNEDVPAFQSCHVEMRKESFYLGAIEVHPEPAEYMYADIDGLIACLEEVRRLLDADSVRNGGPGRYKQ